MFARSLRALGVGGREPRGHWRSDGAHRRRFRGQCRYSIGPVEGAVVGRVRAFSSSSHMRDSYCDEEGDVLRWSARYVWLPAGNAPKSPDSRASSPSSRMLRHVVESGMPVHRPEWYCTLPSFVEAMIRSWVRTRRSERQAYRPTKKRSGSNLGLPSVATSATS